MRLRFGRDGSGTAEAVAGAAQAVPAELPGVELDCAVKSDAKSDFNGVADLIYNPLRSESATSPRGHVFLVETAAEAGEENQSSAP